MNGYSIRKGKVTGSSRSALKGQSVRFMRVGKTVVFSGPADRIPAKVREMVATRVGL